MKSMSTVVLFSVVVAFSLREVFAIDCMLVDIPDIMNCNDCIRCGGYWCNQPDNKDSAHCSTDLPDNWCSKALERAPAVASKSIPGETISPSQYTDSVRVNRESTRVIFKYDWSSSTIPHVEASVVNTTQRNNAVEVNGKPVCENGKCAYKLTVTPKSDFCLPDSGKYEYVNLKVRVENITEEADVKYHVPCACACSDKVETKAKVCNGNGDFSCGVCACYKGWSGTYCEKKEEQKCENPRGDISQCINIDRDTVNCSGNGYCSSCDTCVCYDDREGSQYFQKDNYCADLCLIIASECQHCLRDKPLGKCAECPHSLTLQPYNETALLERDDYNRRVWVNCTENIDEIYYKFTAKRDEKHAIFVMQISNFNNSGSDKYVGGKVNIMLPTVLGVIALLAAGAAVVGGMVWKSRNAALQQTTAKYEGVERPERSAFMNPLYKDPTSSYNNPLFQGAKV